MYSVAMYYGEMNSCHVITHLLVSFLWRGSRALQDYGIADYVQEGNTCRAVEVRDLDQHFKTLPCSS